MATSTSFCAPSPLPSVPCCHLHHDLIHMILDRFLMENWNSELDGELGALGGAAGLFNEVTPLDFRRHVQF